MKIIHIAPNAPYNEGWGYQENLLPKYQHKLGHDVTLIISNRKHEGSDIIDTGCCDYIQKDGVRLIRLQILKGKIIGHLAHLKNIYDVLCDIKPDYIFFHGFVSMDILYVRKYKKYVNPKCYIVQDNHLDYEIGYKCDSLKQYIMRSYYRLLKCFSIKYVNKVYGVTPWRKQYVEDYFKVPKYKTDVLIMGADDDSMDYVNHIRYRNEIRSKYNISISDFLIVSGGKLEDNKNIDRLMNVCGELNNRVKLLLFGSIDDSIKDVFDELLEKYNNIIYVGWINGCDVYKYFYASDLVCFPGRHSVLWEQACASKVPCLFEHWEGMEHVNNGGNSDFVFPITIDTLKNKIISLIYSDKYFQMKDIAESEKTNIYLYTNIAKKSLDCLL